MAHKPMTEHDLEQATKEQIVTGLSLKEAGESALENPEPWEPWETSLVLWSLLIGIGGLIILGTLINIFLLH
ncbi:hypothetical protein BGP_6078 [Beggiatoa sp. PS]|nr:hypothetical protein BGP_6078 [Beggiatoa sp. PS]